MDNLNSLIDICSLEWGDQAVRSLRKGLTKAETLETQKSTEAAAQYKQCLSQASTLRDSKSKGDHSKTKAAIDEIIKILESKGSSTPDSSAKRGILREKAQSEPVKRSEKIITFGETHRVYQYAPKNNREQDRLVHSFVGMRVRDATSFEVSPLYRQCIRSVSCPSGKTKMSSPTVLLRIQTVFQVDEVDHNQLVKEEANFGKPHLLFLLQAQLESLSSHPYYTKNSFVYGKDWYSRWIKQESAVLKKAISSFKQPITPSKEFSDLEFATSTEQGFKCYDQLFKSLTSYDLIIAQRNMDQEALLTKTIEEISDAYFNERGLKPIDLTAYFTARPEAAEPFHCSSPVTTWILDQFAFRYRIGPLYRDILSLSFFSTDFNLSLRSCIWIHVLLGRCLKHIKDDTKIFNKYEVKFLSQTVKDLYSHLVDQIMKQFFHHFTVKSQDLLTIVVKLIVLCAECKKYIKHLQGKTDSVVVSESELISEISQSFTVSTTNLYQQCLYAAPVKEVDANGVNMDRVTPEPVSHAKQVISTTPRQFVHVIESLSSIILDSQSFQLSWLKVDIVARCQQELMNQLSSDIKFFTRREIKDFKAAQCLNLVLAYRDLCDEWGFNDTHDIIPSFGPLVRVYIDQFEASMLERINTSCRLPKTWIPASHQKPHWAEVEKWTDECVGAISLLRKLKFLQKYDQALPLPYLKQFAETLGRIWTTLQEIVYNLFIDEFPVEQHAFVHDVYLKANFRFTLTGGVESARIPASRRFSLFPKKTKIEHVTKTKSSVLVQRPTEVADPQGPPKYEIEIWRPKVILNKKKALKYKLTRPKTNFSESMFVKLQTIIFLRTWLASLNEREKKRGDEFQEMCEKSIALSNRIFHAFIGTLIYAMDFTLTSQFESMLEPKKKVEKIFSEIMDQEEYIQDQLAVLLKYFSPDMFKQFVLRLCITVVKSIEGLIFDTPEPKAVIHLIILDLLVGHFCIFCKSIYSTEDFENLVADFHSKIEEIADPDYTNSKTIFELSKKQVYGIECRLTFPRLRGENVTHSSDERSYSASKSFSQGSSETTVARHHRPSLGSSIGPFWKKDSSNSSKISRTISSSLSEKESNNNKRPSEDEAFSGTPTLRVTIQGSSDPDKHHDYLHGSGSHPGSRHGSLPPSPMVSTPCSSEDDSPSPIPTPDSSPSSLKRNSSASKKQSRDIAGGGSGSSTPHKKERKRASSILRYPIRAQSHNDFLKSSSNSRQGTPDPVRITRGGPNKRDSSPELCIKRDSFDSPSCGTIQESPPSDKKDHGLLHVLSAAGSSTPDLQLSGSSRSSRGPNKRDSMPDLSKRMKRDSDSERPPPAEKTSARGTPRRDSSPSPDILKVMKRGSDNGQPPGSPEKISSRGTTPTPRRDSSPSDPSGSPGASRGGPNKRDSSENVKKSLVSLKREGSGDKDRGNGDSSHRHQSPRPERRSLSFPLKREHVEFSGLKGSGGSKKEQTDKDKDKDHQDHKDKDLKETKHVSHQSPTPHSDSLRRASDSPFRKKSESTGALRSSSLDRKRTSGSADLTGAADSPRGVRRTASLGQGLKASGNLSVKSQKSESSESSKKRRSQEFKNSGAIKVATISPLSSSTGAGIGTLGGSSDLSSSPPTRAERNSSVKKEPSQELVKTSGSMKNREHLTSSSGGGSEVLRSPKKRLSEHGGGHSSPTKKDSKSDLRSFLSPKNNQTSTTGHNQDHSTSDLGSSHHDGGLNPVTLPRKESGRDLLRNVFSPRSKDGSPRTPPKTPSDSPRTDNV